MYLTDASRSLISCVIQHYAPVVGWGGWRNRCIMLIMTLDPSWRQTLRLPPPGIEPGSPASQTGTLPKELSRQLTPVLRIRDFYPRSRILISSHSGSWIQNSNKREGWKKICCHNFLFSQKFHKIANYFSFELLKKNLGQFSKNYRTFKPKLSISSQKYEVGIQDPRSGIRKIPIPDPGSRGQQGPVSNALSLPPPGIEPGSPASQAGTLPKELSR